MQSKKYELLTHPLWQDERMERSGFLGGLTKRSIGNMKDSGNRRGFFETSKSKGVDVRVLNQVHGTKIFKASAQTGSSGVLEGDGWICDEPGITPCILVADCLPIFIWSGKGHAFGVFHAGWRGLAKSFAYIAAVEMQKAFGLSPKDLIASVGPHIGVCCCRVGPEIKEFFPSEDFISDKEGLRLDLNLEAKNQLLRVGLLENSISLSSECTVCSGDYFSYRNGEAERMAAFMSISRPMK